MLLLFLDKYLVTSAVKTSAKFYNITFSYDMIFTKADAYTSDEQAENLTRVQYSLHRLHWIIDLFVIYKSRFEFCSTQVRKVFIKPWKYILKHWHIY